MADIADIANDYAERAPRVLIVRGRALING